MSRALPAVALALTVLASACLLPGGAGPVILLVPGASETKTEFESRVRQAFSLAQPGTTFEFGAGTFALTRGLGVTASHITVRGQGPGQTILDFSTASAAEAILATGNEFTIADIGIFDPPGDGVKTVGVDGVLMHRVNVVWLSDADPTNGPYGLYPVLSSNILIEGCYVRGAEDAGIYVGQSMNVKVKNNWAEFNVAGIEIENTINAEVSWNVATENTAGILVFDLTGLSQAGHSVSVHHNWSYNNNGPNFGSGVVGLVPPGTGLLVLSTDDVEIYENQIHDNITAGIAVLSYDLTLLPYDPAVFDPYPETIFIHDNVMQNNGTSPQGTIGQVIALQFGFGAPIPDIVWDRNMNPALVQPDGELPPALKFCVQNNGAATIGTLAPPPSGDRFDVTPYDCTHTPVPRVQIRDALALPPGQQDLTPAETAMLCGAQPAGVNWPAYEANCPTLSDYNLFVGNDPRGPVVERGLEYELTTPLFSDYANKYRFAFVPFGMAASYDPDQVMDFPDGNPRTIDYVVPDVNQCAGCHTGINEPMDLIGPKARLLNRPVPGGGPNQLDAWTSAGILTGAPAPASAPRLPVWNDAADGTVAERARAYLESNCAHCHRPNGRAGFTSLWLTADTPDGFNTGICKTPIAAGVGGLTYDIEPGDPDQSILVFRMESVVPSVQMPELAKVIVHDAGNALVRDWVTGLPGPACP